MSAVAVAALGAALLCAPGRAGTARLGALLPRASRRRVPHLPAALWLVAVGAVGGALVLGVAGGITGAGAAALWQHRRSARRIELASAATSGQLADALARMTDELRVGAHPATALDGVRQDGPWAEQLLGPAAAAARLGDDVPAALRRTAAGPSSEDLRRVAAAWGLADRHGAPLALLLDGALSDIRWRLAFGARVRAQLAGPRATAAVLTGLPALGLGLGHLMGADPLGVLRTGFLGQLLLLLGAGFVVAGQLWTARILRAAVPR
ncbi:MAG: secretion system protein [Pseudonocardia sp.]|nr:secretion system protein [Pseudonocardia sp.]